MAQARKNTATKSTQAKKSAPAKKRPEPVRIDSNREIPEPERTPLFYIDDVEYTIPTEVSPSVLFRYLSDVHEHGNDRAVANAMYELMGEEAIEALGQSRAVMKDDVQQIFDIVEGILMDELGGMTGK